MAANWGNWPPGHEEKQRRLLIFSDTTMPLWVAAERHTLVGGREASEGAERRHALGSQEAGRLFQHLGGKYEPMPPLFFKYEPTFPHLQAGSRSMNVLRGR